LRFFVLVLEAAPYYTNYKETLKDNVHNFLTIIDTKRKLENLILEDK